MAYKPVFFNNLMKECMLVLAKAMPVVSKSYEHLVCVAGITDKGEWRRIYPIPWRNFFLSSESKFSKKSWIEYELESDRPSDRRPESRKIYYLSIRPLREENFLGIKKMLDERITTLEALSSKSHREVSLGVIRPVIEDFVEDESNIYEKLKERTKQMTLLRTKAIKIDVPRKSFSYAFRCSDNCKGHKMMCEDWELGELYRNCERYREEGRYSDEVEVFNKVKQRMFNEMLYKKELYFILGTHNIYGTYIIISVIYPRKSDAI